MKQKTNRKEKAERANGLLNEAIESLAATLENGQSEGLKLYFEAMARFSRYSFSNIALIVAQRPDATHIQGFRGWRNLGRNVKKGEKGIMIRAPFTIRKDKEAGRDSEDRIHGFKAAYVFDVSQTEGEELPSIATVSGEPSAYTEQLKQYAAANGIAVEYSADINEFGRSAGGIITLSTKQTVAEEFCTLAHEIAHEKLHYNPNESLSKVVRETEAEAVAFVVSSAIGLDARQAAADYIGLYQGDAKTLSASMSRIRDTAFHIIEFLQDDEQVKKAA